MRESDTTTMQWMRKNEHSFYACMVYLPLLWLLLSTHGWCCIQVKTRLLLTPSALSIFAWFLLVLWWYCYCLCSCMSYFLSNTYEVWSISLPKYMCSTLQQINEIYSRKKTRNKIERPTSENKPPASPIFYPRCKSKKLLAIFLCSYIFVHLFKQWILHNIQLSKVFKE